MYMSQSESCETAYSETLSSYHMQETYMETFET